MQVNVSAKNTTLTPTLESYIREKSEHLSHYFDNIIRVEVQIEVEKHKTISREAFRAEIMVHVPKKVLRAEHRASEMHEAFDLVVPKIQKQLERYKEKLRRRDKGFLHRMKTVFGGSESSDLEE